MIPCLNPINKLSRTIWSIWWLASKTHQCFYFQWSLIKHRNQNSGSVHFVNEKIVSSLFPERPTPVSARTYWTWKHFFIKWWYGAQTIGATNTKIGFFKRSKCNHLRCCYLNWCLLFYFEVLLADILALT